MSTRTGLRIRAHKIDRRLAERFKIFANWLRENYEFSIRVPVYLSAGKYVVGSDGDEYVSIFFAPFDSDVEPYIRIATGDYKDLIAEDGEESAVYDELFQLALNIAKYEKWVENNSEFDSYDAKDDANVMFQSFIESQPFEFDD